MQSLLNSYMDHWIIQVTFDYFVASVTVLFKCWYIQNLSSDQWLVLFKCWYIQNLSSHQWLVLFKCWYIQNLSSDQPKACNFIKKESLVQVFFCEFCKISNTFFYRTLPVAASDIFFSTLILCFRHTGSLSPRSSFHIG